PEEGLAGKCRLRAERQGANHVGSAAHATVHEHRRASADLGGDGRQHVDCGGKGLDLTAAMVGDPYPLDAQGDRPLSVARVANALDNTWTFPAFAKAGDFVPGEGAANLAASERDHVIGAGVFTHIGLEVGEARMTIL